MIRDSHTKVDCCRHRRWLDVQGSVIIRQRVKHVKQTADGRSKEKERLEPCVLHCDIIRDHFWQQHAELLA
jgi:hypothetical protein